MHEQLLDKNGNYMALDITIEDKMVYMPFEMEILKERQDCFFQLSYKVINVLQTHLKIFKIISNLFIC